jgi:hypothetical protein
LLFDMTTSTDCLSNQRCTFNYKTTLFDPFTAPTCKSAQSLYARMCETESSLAQTSAPLAVSTKALNAASS